MMMFQKLGGALRLSAARSCLLRESLRASAPASANRLFTSDGVDEEQSLPPSTKLFVGGLAWSADDNTLRDAFAEYGVVTEAKVVVDRVTGRSRGYGFVNFETVEDASKARDNLNNQAWMGRTIRVDWAVQKSPEERLMSRGGGGGRRYNNRGDYGSSGGGGGGWSSGGMGSFGGI